MRTSAYRQNKTKRAIEITPEGRSYVEEPILPMYGTSWHASDEALAAMARLESLQR